ncbi:MAG: Dyp-type peroxidase [Acidimicrobiaceae bacterium]|nr:Dyp-type peroxidase [Acidimicrobiaceae bacterium]
MSGNDGGLSRRAFLRGSATTALVAAGAASGLGVPGVGEASAAPTFHGKHQAGILTSPERAHVVVSLDVTTESRAELTDYFRTLTEQIRGIVAGGPVTEAFNAGIAPDNGMLGPVIPANQLTPTVSIGASLFDRRFGLADRKPLHLTLMKSFPNDDLDQTRCHGDVVVQFQAAERDTVTHALRRIMQATDGVVQPRWRLDGFVNPPRPTGVPRNLFGFNDGVSNPDVTSAAQMDALVWADPAKEPAWAAGGTYVVIRTIRQLVEFWDRVSVEEQETIIGRRRDSGAPLGENSVNDAPNFAADPQGNTTPLTAHIRLANPRTAATADSRILRRAVNYDRGLDVNGNLDQGLIFICYQQDIARQFEAIQTRLINEPMVDYVSPVGGGYYFTLPGVTGPDDYFASGLLA